MVAPQPPPISSPLVSSSTGSASALVHFGSYQCNPKSSVLIKIRLARRNPSLTSAAKHSYRLTDKGLELIAEKGPLVSCPIPAHVIVEEYRAAARRRQSPLPPT
ncbi:hypothetical protein MJO28_005147 [Puccinia striiformis f. sp. tritici]|uniref:Uncharacterized protein n=1 Tax=Puccinia striiformis f. sp. tritici TaxID=168172 RepID=A0ACC0EL43_9BASI|nr:hypothetical protein Pst134EA_009312 [Puccinia striiformis f. sp. tritici]KAH9468780.1 hypothetical protein Pst134EA_009312 [Puccinia striiformis f. sp. tritici]KAI7954747.1 hypothetical protein MJO28_005147 [Puccinia striiformis f. sp. tritici]KAI9622379.1 hypothetical protein KEM48_007270 [Puccinia striiformis f. sp. tritici PST-130]